MSLENVLHHELDAWERQRERGIRVSLEPVAMTATERGLRVVCDGCGQPLDDAAMWVPDRENPTWLYPHCGHCLGVP